MACLSSIFHRKPKKTDTELRNYSVVHISDSDSDPEEVKHDGPPKDPPLYTPSKTLLNAGPPPDLQITPTPVLETEDLSFLSTPKTFTDYFISTCEKIANPSQLVVEENESFSMLLRLEAEENWEIKLSKPNMRIFIKNVRKM
jgi:hypothetical protein